MPHQTNRIAGSCRKHGPYEGSKCPSCISALRYAQDAAGIVRKGGPKPSVFTGCQKVQYSSRRDAERAAIQWALTDLKRKGRGRVNTAYYCTACEAWHRTSKVNGK